MTDLPPDYSERAYAAVLGKLIGVYLGRPFEGWTYQRIIDELGPIEDYVHERLDCPLVVTDDDVAGTFTFIRALEDHGAGSSLTARKIGETWLNYIVENRSILWWGGNGVSTEHTAWLNLKRGVEAPASGSIEVNGSAVAEQIGAQIFIDGWAIVAPGNPSLAAQMARQAAKVSHDGAAVDAATLWAAMEAEAFVSRDVEHLIDVGLRQIPDDSPIAKLVADIRRWRGQHEDWRETRAAIEAQYGYDKYPGNCHVVPNHALMIMALLYAPDDFSRAQTIICTSGWDTDCNAGNVGCLLGAMLGLEGLDRGHDWRSPIADRMLISSADGENAINDAVRVAARLTDLGRRIAGLDPLPAPKDGAQFNFSQPGSVQGFMPPASESVRVTVGNIAFGDTRALRMEFRGLAAEKVAVLTPTFAGPDVTRMRTYELMASPLVYPGQTVSARIVADLSNESPVAVSLRALVYGAQDQLFPIDSDETTVSPGADRTLVWRLQDTGGQPVQSLGLAVRSPGGAQDAGLAMDWLRWDGVPDMRLRRPATQGDFWRRAWVNAASVFLTRFPKSFLVSQDRGEGMIIQGGRSWTDYRLEADLTVHLADQAGLGIRVQGLRRYYAAVLVRPNLFRLLRAHDGNVVVLSETPFVWAFEKRYEVTLEMVGNRIRASVGNTALEATDDDPLAPSGGGVALIVAGGACSSDEIRICPPTSVMQASGAGRSRAPQMSEG